MVQIINDLRTFYLTLICFCSEITTFLNKKILNYLYSQPPTMEHHLLLHKNSGRHVAMFTNTGRITLTNTQHSS